MRSDVVTQIASIDIGLPSQLAGLSAPTPVQGLSSSTLNTEKSLPEQKSSPSKGVGCPAWHKEAARGMGEGLPGGFQYVP